ncbi:MAG: L,D-transpeptidase family protein [Fusobacteriaceae bacterium]
MTKSIILFLAALSLVGCSSTQVKQKESEKTIIYDSNFDNQSKLPFIEVYENRVPQNIGFQEKYKGGHPEVLDYIFIRTVTANVRDLPGVSTEVKEVLNFNERVKVTGKVETQGTKWYKVETDKGNVGYISNQVVAFRTFRFVEALEEIKKVENFVEKGKQNGIKLGVTNSYVPNPQNTNFRRQKDKYGNTWDQNVAGKINGEVVFISDRSIVKVLEDDGNQAKVKVSSIPEDYLMIDSKYLSKPAKLVEKPITKAVAVDTTNQNIIVFEKIDGKWQVISYVYSKTGIESQLGFETPKGHFLAAVSKFTMGFTDEFGKMQGSAKYATRFSGGGYVHGTPVAIEEEAHRAYFISQKEQTLGTYTGTRKCVRTTEDHAEFVFKWVLNGKINKKNNDQTITDNVLFVII